MALGILVWNSSTSKINRNTTDPTQLVAFQRSQSTALTNGTTSVAITFSTAVASTNYSVVCTMRNTTDANPQFQPITITAVTTTGFVANWNVALDSGNYFLNYQANAYL